MKTHVCFVVDRSGSMQPHKNELVPFLKQLIEDMKNEVTITIILFNGLVDEVNSFDSYIPSGGTALMDAFGYAKNKMEQIKADRYLMFVLTDGEENVSRHVSKRNFTNQIKKINSLDNWSLVFQVPTAGYKNELNSSFGVPLENIAVWDKVDQVVASTQQSMQNYVKSTAKKTEVFFVDTKVDMKEVKQKLTDMSKKFVSLIVRDKISIKDFVEAVTGKPYKVGSAYYQLLKKETVQSNKYILVQERGQKEIYGGASARSLVGLPAVGDAKVTPAHLGKYDIYVQSTSVNRNLQPNTLLLLEK